MPVTPAAIAGEGLTLRRWDEGLVRQMAAWGQHGFPFHAFDLGHLADPAAAARALAQARAPGKHLHLVACEGEVAVGRVSVNLRDEAGLYLWAVHVPPEHEGRGVARRMLAAVMAWLEKAHPGRDFVLTANSFAVHAHRAYRAVGFEVTETRWHYDRELADLLWRVTPAERGEITRYMRFQDGRWQIHALVFRRRAGTPMDTRAGPLQGGESGQRPQAPRVQ